MASVFVLATLDTKGREADFVRRLLTSWGVGVTLVDTARSAPPAVAADISRERIFELAGTTLEAVRKRADRGEAVTSAADGRGEARPRGVRARRAGGRARPGRIGGNDHRHGGDEGAAARRTRK